MKFEKYRTKKKNGEWHWRLRAANGEIIAHGESYKTEQAANEAIALVQSSINARVKTVEK